MTPKELVAGLLREHGYNPAWYRDENVYWCWLKGNDGMGPYVQVESTEVVLGTGRGPVGEIVSLTHPQSLIIIIEHVRKYWE